MSGTILIVDDVATNRIVLKARLSAACYDTIQAADALSALRLARLRQPDLILLDVMLPGLSGIELCQRLRADPLTREIPVIMLTAFRDADARREALRAGADDFLSKPMDETMLLARIRNLLRAHETEKELRLRDETVRAVGLGEAPAEFDCPGTIALIAARRETALAWRRALEPHLSDRLVVIPREAALADPSVTPDVFVIAADLAEQGDGLRLISDLRSRAATRHSNVCIVLQDGAENTGAMALDLGANELLSADFDAQETALRLHAQLRRKRQADRLRASVRDGLRLAVTDPLTGLHNRRYAMPHLARIAERARQTGRSYAVMVLDLDRFKEVNDTWGHAAGDAVLVEVARRLRDNLRPVDLLARIGGEEFIVAMPDTQLGTARLAAERLCQVIEATPIPIPGAAGSVRVTLSIGLAMGKCPPEGCDDQKTADEVLERADRALLGAKAEGRNKVAVGRCAA
jgi:two-component system, cell cycle response regulator